MKKQVIPLDKNLHKQYIIHQVLQYGDLDDFKWLNSLYSPRTFNFVKKYLLHIDNNLDATQYVSNL